MIRMLFKKKEEVTDISVVAPINGELVELQNVPDPVFSEKMLGEGVAIKPTEGEVIAPVDGKIIQVFPTKHAVGILAENGAEILIHIGLETVNLEGEGFTAHVVEGDKITRGDKLISFDLGLISEKAESTLTPIVITNTKDMGSVIVSKLSEVEAGKDEILKVSK